MALCERVKVCKAIGDAKKKQGMPITGYIKGE